MELLMKLNIQTWWSCHYFIHVFKARNISLWWQYLFWQWGAWALELCSTQVCSLAEL